MSQILLTPLPLTNLALEQWVKLIDEASVVGLDFETTGLEVYDGRDKGRGFAVALRSSTGIIRNYFPISHPLGENLQEEHWRPLLVHILKRPVVFHNATFDLNCLYNLGYPAPEVYFDTMKLDHLIDENNPSYKLDLTTERWLGYKAKNRTPRFEAALLAWGWGGMPSDIMHEYAQEDGAITLESLEKMVKHKEFTPKLVDYWKKIEQPTITLLSEMRRMGVRVNVEYCAEMQAIGEARMAELESELGGKASSPKFLGKLLNEELGLPVLLNKEGKVSFDKETMKRYEQRITALSAGDADRATLASRILEYRGWQKAVSGYYTPYQRFVSSDGRLRASYNITGTRTGRFSCSDPNLQQIPKESDKEWSKGVKSALIAESGYTLWELDYSQLEFRLAAAASKEESLCDIFMDPERDIFTEMSKVLGMVRQDTKTLNYSIQYGAGTPRVMDAFNIGEDRARSIIDNYYRQYPNLRAASKYFGQLARGKGYVEIWSGRRRHFRNPSREFYKAFNSYIQGGAADLVKLAMVEARREVCNDECRLLLQVHDSLVLEIKNGMEDYYLPQIREIMIRHSDYFGVRLDADAHRWSKNEE